MSEFEKHDAGPIVPADFVSALAIVIRPLPDETMGQVLGPLMTSFSEYNQRQLETEMSRRMLDWHNAYHDYKNPDYNNPYERMIRWLHPIVEGPGGS